MEAVGAAAGALAFASALLTTGKALHKAVKKLHRAPAELQSLTNEITIFATLYREFGQTCQSELSSSHTPISSPAMRLKAWSEDALTKFEKLLQDVKAIAKDEKGYSRIEQWFARFRWLRDTPAIKALRASLSVARESVSCMTNIRCIQHLQDILASLKSALGEKDLLRELEVRYGCDIQTVTSLLECRIQEHSATKIRLRAAKKVLDLHIEKTKPDMAIVPNTKKLHNLASSTKKYADTVVPKSHSGSSSSNSSRRQHGSSRSSSSRILISPPSSTLTSQSSATQSTGIQQQQSVSPSSSGVVEESSPPTSPEMVPEEVTSNASSCSILNECERCRGTCVRTKEHGTAVSDGVSLDGDPDERSVPSPPPQISRNAQVLVEEVGMAEVGAEVEADVEEEGEGDVEVEEEDEVEDDEEEKEEEEVQASNAGNSIWRATGAFGGHEPRNLRKKREERSSS